MNHKAKLGVTYRYEARFKTEKEIKEKSHLQNETLAYVSFILVHVDTKSFYYSVGSK